MKRTSIYLLIIGFIQFVLYSCNTSYLTHSSINNNFTEEGQLQLERDIIRAQMALQRPSIEYDDIEKTIVKSHTNIAEKLENNTFVSYSDLATEHILKEADSYIGTPYRFGGTSRSGIDCSAFIQKIYRVEGIDLPRISRNQAKVGVPVPRERLQKGDLIFFSTTSPRRITHVGMVYEANENETLFIHSSSSQGVTISSLNESYWANRYRTARRLNQFITPQLVLAETDSKDDSL